MRNGRPEVVEIGGRDIHWKIFQSLYRRKDIPCNPRDLWNEVWGEKFTRDDSTLHPPVSQLRKSLETLGVTILHMKGLGYILADSPQPGVAANRSSSRKRI